MANNKSFDAKAYFKELQDINNSIFFIEKEIEKNDELSKKISSGALNEFFQKYAFKSNNAVFVKAIHSMVDLRDILNKAIEELSYKKQNIFSILMELKPRYQTIIQMKYIQGMSVKEISHYLGTSERKIYSMIDEATADFEDKWRKKYTNF